MSQVLVLYQISNEFPPHAHAPAPAATPHYNGFYMPRPPGTGVTLSSVKSYSHQRILQNVHPAGSHGYHWRVRIDERPHTSHDSGASSSSSSTLYSWWDVQDENARLPVREYTASELKKLFRTNSKKEAEGELQEVTKAAKGAMKYVGKAMNAVAGSGMYDNEEDSGVRVAVICFKLLDLYKVSSRGGGRSGGRVRQRNGSVGGVRKQPMAPPRAAAPVSAGAPRVTQSQQQQQPQQRRPPPSMSTASSKSVPTANLMDFGNTAAPARPTLSHSASMPAVTATPTGSLPNETRAQKLKREYAQKASTSNRVWDEVDQRWVEGPVKNGETSQPTASTASTASAINETSKSLKGISLDPSNAIGKSPTVASAINARVTAMQSSQQKAISELREREAQKSAADAEEEAVRIRLEPKLRAWSEEHGQKKQLRALLANLHTILWEDSGWKAISLAEVLEESKVKKVYHRASRVVHPDKTGGLDAEKRFVAKRVFDALTQAKVEFDAGAK